MATAGLVSSALGIFGLDGPGVAHCSLTAAFLETDHSDPDVAAQGTLATLANDPLNDARWLDLPCGPGVSCVTLRELALDLEPAPLADEQPKLITGRIQVHVPFPTGPSMAVFTLDTASMEYWQLLGFGGRGRRKSRGDQPMTFAAAHSTAGTPLVTRIPDGAFRVEIRSSGRGSPFHGLCRGLCDMVVGPDGEEIKARA